jgi:hypothetical protein
LFKQYQFLTRVTGQHPRQFQTEFGSVVVAIAMALEATGRWVVPEPAR